MRFNGLKLVLISAVFFGSLAVHAGIDGVDSSGRKLGVMTGVECSTGLTCTKHGANLKIVSSPTLTGTSLTLSSTLEADGNFSVNTDKFTVAASSGNTAIAGTANVVGNFSVATNKFNVAAASGNTTVGGQFIVSTSASPAAADACTAGRVAWDSSYLYVCTASGAWKRAALTGSY